MESDGVLAELAELEARLAVVAAGFDPDAVPDPLAPPVWQTLDRLVRYATVCRTRMARRLEESGAWQREGFGSAVEHLAARAGTSLGAARAELDTSRALASLPDLTAALGNGSVSPAQAVVVAGAAAVNPAAAADLVAAAGRESHRELQSRALRAKAAADPHPEAREQRIHRGRHARTFVDDEGAWNLCAQGTVVDGAAIAAAINAVVDELFDERRSADPSSRDTYDARSFDALLRLCRDGAKPETRPSADPGDGGGTACSARRPTPRALVRLDLEALRRGAVDGDEACEIAGVGPIPVVRAVELLGDATVHLLITKGVDVLNVTTLSRRATAAMLAALSWTHRSCAVEGCGRTIVEVDHRLPWAQTKHTRLTELDPLCHLHHRKKTHDGWALVDGTGPRPFVPCDDPRHPRTRAGPSASHQPEPLWSNDLAPSGG